MSDRRILIVNDDGISAPGIELLESVARELSDDVWVVAPAADRSGAASSVTLTLPVRTDEVDERHIGVTGTPTDCLVLAVDELLDRPPDLVLSGINRGANLGTDVRFSGTFAVVMEAAREGIPAIALSQDFVRGEEVPWETAREYALPTIRRLLDLDLADIAWNVNFPAIPPAEVKGVRVTHQGARVTKPFEITHRLDPSGRDYYWLRYTRHEEHAGEAESDLAASAAGYVSVTPMPLRSHPDAELASAREAFGLAPTAGGAKA
jgi:5'-nucleotidase